VHQKKAALRKSPDAVALQNTKIAFLKGQNATDESINSFLGSVASRKDAGVKIASVDNPSLQDAFIAIDRLIESGTITHAKAAEALEELHQRQDSTKVAAIVKVAASLDNVLTVKRAMAEPLPPEAGGAPMPPPAGPEGAPPPAGPEGAPPAGDPTAAIDQLLGALEQLVVAGVIGEDQAVKIVQDIGIAPPDAGGAPPDAGGAPPAPEAGMPPAGPAAPPMV
jgi:hypothetical protein